MTVSLENEMVEKKFSLVIFSFIWRGERGETIFRVTADFCFFLGICHRNSFGKKTVNEPTHSPLSLSLSFVLQPRSQGPESLTHARFRLPPMHVIFLGRVFPPRDSQTAE